MAAHAFEVAHELILDFDPDSLAEASDAQLCNDVTEVEALSRTLSAVQVALAAEIAERSRRDLGAAGLAQRHGCVTPGPLLEQLARISGAEASRRIQLGGALRSGRTLTSEPLPPRFPVLAAAVAAGEVGPEAAGVIVRALDDVRRVAAPADLDVAEAGLVQHAQVNPVQYVADLAMVVRDRLDPDGVRPREQETKARRGIQLGRERNGIVPIRGGLAPLPASLLRAAFDEANAPGVQPRFLSDDDRLDGTTTTVDEAGRETVTIRDVRTREQRQHDVLEGLLTAGIRNTGLEPGQIRSMAQVTAHISLADLESGTGIGWIDGIRESVSVQTISRLLCDAEFRRVVIGNDGEVLAFGKARYPFSSAQRKAMVARDGDTCVLCDAPVAWADAHHVQEYYTNGAAGKTDVENGVLLCPRHHDLIHHTQWRIGMFNGVPHVLAPPDIDPAQRWKRVGRRRVALRQSSSPPTRCDAALLVP